MIFDYERPEDYPDWDGDESIMYYIDHYTDNEEEDDTEDTDWIICEVCGNEILVEDEANFICPICGAVQNI